jgi:hypothetical protein
MRYQFYVLPNHDGEAECMLPRYIDHLLAAIFTSLSVAFYKNVLDSSP